ncbi:hypothetical protein [Pseudomonas aeruginosa]|uniref:hypothetical protein n=1 Tax=Pseudomonas aeruginosa TaxID=287 RepID=UPI002F3FF500
MSIDWSCAPAEATHYCIGDDLNPWRKIVGTTVYALNRKKWVMWSSFNEGYMPAYYAPIPLETWDGQGLPPVGAKCLTDRNDFLREVTILCHGKTRTFVFDHVSQEEICLVLKDRVFLPIHTPEQIAAEERSKECDRIFVILSSVEREGNRSDMAEALYDAGLRLTNKK